MAAANVVFENVSTQTRPITAASKFAKMKTRIFGCVSWQKNRTLAAPIDAISQGWFPSELNNEATITPINGMMVASASLAFELIVRAEKFEVDLLHWVLECFKRLVDLNHHWLWPAEVDFGF